MGRRVQRIESADEREALRRRARVLVTRSLMIAAATGVAVWLVARLVRA